MKKIEKSIELGGRKLTLSTGHVAKQATGAVMASYGDTVVLATVVSAPLMREIDYFPLSVEYQERLYAGGKIKGSRWIKREGRPSDDEILISRLIDRSIRPLFDKEYKREVQVVVTVLSVDLENPPDILAGIAVSAAISLSTIPWKGPVGMVRVGLDEKDGFVLNPVRANGTMPKLDLVVSSAKESIVMIESGADQVSEEKMLDGIEYARKEAEKITSFIDDFVGQVDPKKENIDKKKIDSSIEKKVKELTQKEFEKLINQMAVKEGGNFEFVQLKQAVADHFEGEEKPQSMAVFEDLFKKTIREMILSGKRPDDRKYDQIRELSAEISVLPRTHGSAIFSRGQTQAMSITTLGSRTLEQLIESAEGEESKRYIHHYSMPPYSVGEVGRVGSPSRREIGHGALAERALIPVIPSEEEFPYTIRVVTEVLGSNGSTSMASTCGSTLSLMDAGVPIKSPVAGIAIGLVAEDAKKYKILTDIIGLEDFNGDMDFKVAGTKDGITALQLDVKTLLLNVGMLKEAFEQAKKARFEILDVIAKTISDPKEQVSAYAPKIKIVKIPVDKIGELIGPGGRNIKAIIAQTGAAVDVEDDGTVSISAVGLKEMEDAVNRVNAITKDPVAGEIYEGIVKRIQPFGAFVEILPGKDGMVHVSDMSGEFVSDPRDIVNIGDKVQVRVKEIDDMGRINLSMNMDPASDSKKDERRGNGGNRFEGNNRGGYKRDFRRDDRYRGRSNDRSRNFRSGGVQDRGAGGPHFPTSRLLDEVQKGKGE